MPTQHPSAASSERVGTRPCLTGTRIAPRSRSGRRRPEGPPGLGALPDRGWNQAGVRWPTATVFSRSGGLVGVSSRTEPMDSEGGRARRAARTAVVPIVGVGMGAGGLATVRRTVRRTAAGHPHPGPGEGSTVALDLPAPTLRDPGHDEALRGPDQGARRGRIRTRRRIAVAVRDLRHSRARSARRDARPDSSSARPSGPTTARSPRSGWCSPIGLPAHSWVRCRIR